MISLRALLKEVKNKNIKEAAFAPGAVPPMVKLVWYDDKHGLKDVKKQKEVLRILERNLRKQQESGLYKYSVSDIMNDIKYYPATDKIVGNYPKNVFLDPRWKDSNTIRIDKCRFEHELEQISKTLMVKSK